MRHSEHSCHIGTFFCHIGQFLSFWIVSQKTMFSTSKPISMGRGKRQGGWGSEKEGVATCEVEMKTESLGCWNNAGHRWYGLRSSGQERPAIEKKRSNEFTRVLEGRKEVSWWGDGFEKRCLGWQRVTAR